MAHARMTLSLMDSDLVEGMVRAILALHQADEDGDCLDCRDTFPCATVRIIASTQDAAVYRVSNPPSFEDQIRKPKEPWQEDLETMARGPLTHDFKYPECPEFSGGICERHHGRPLHPAAA